MAHESPTVEEIREHAKAHGLVVRVEAPRYVAETVEAVREAGDKGMTAAELAAVLGHSHSAAGYRLRQARDAGFLHRQPDPTAEAVAGQPPYRYWIVRKGDS